MKKKIIQLAIVLIGAALLSVGAVKSVPRTPPEKQADQTGDQGADTNAQLGPSPQEEALAQIRPEVYSSVKELTVPEGTRISILMREGDGEFAETFEEGCLQAGDDLNEALGFTGKDKVKISCNAPAKAQDISGQGAILDEELNLYPDVMAVSLVDAGSSEVQFDLARDNGVDIIGFDAVPAYKHTAATVTTDNAKAAAEAADHLNEGMEANQAKGKVMVFAANNTASNLRAREKAFVKRLAKKAPKTEVACVYHLSELEDRRVEVATALAGADKDGDKIDPEEIDPEAVGQEEVIGYLFDRNPDVAGVYLADEQTAEIVLKVMRDKGITACTVAFGGYEELVDEDEEHLLAGVIEENPYGMGYATAVAALRIAAGVDKTARIDTGYRWQPTEP